jgi:protein gp37
VWTGSEAIVGSTTIEWTDRTWNPGIYGCEEVSPACAQCYAAKMAHRLSAAGVYPPGITVKRASGVHWSGKVEVADLVTMTDAAVRSLPQRKRARVFVTSMSDVRYLDDERMRRMFAVFAVYPHLTFQVLTKDPAALSRWFAAASVDELAEDAGHVARAYLGLREFVWDAPGSDVHLCRTTRPWPGWPLPNVWLGTTVEDRPRADERIPHLRRIPAAVRFLSCEPLLGPVADSLGALEGIHWVIAGGESGPGARPSDPDWFADLAAACRHAGVPFFFKQWGEWGPLRDGVVVKRGRSMPSGALMGWLGRAAAGRELLGRTWDQFPEER